MTTLDIQINSPLTSAVGIDLDPARLEFGKTFAPDWFVSEYRNGSWQNALVDNSPEMASGIGDVNSGAGFPAATEGHCGIVGGP